MNERRIQRIQELIKERVAEVIDRDLADPQLGMITVTRVTVDRELQHCVVYWSVLGDDKDRRRNEQVLTRAAGYVQREVAKVLHTRTAPRVRFEFDADLEGALRLERVLEELRAEREAKGSATAEPGDDSASDGDPVSPPADPQP